MKIENMLIDEIKKTLSVIREKNLYPHIRVVDGISSEPEIVVQGKKVLLFCSGNYLGLANHPDIIGAIKKGLDRYGIHPAGSRLISGTLDIHLELERKIAEFKNAEDAMIFTTGTMANIGTIPALLNLPNLSVYAVVKSIFKQNKGAIFSDELNHATIIDGARLARADKIIYKHRNLKDLEEKLRSNVKKRKLIVTDSVFSMDGDITPLPDIIKLARKYNAALMVDDAHGVGVLGKYGGGIMEHFGLTKGVDIQMGTFSKAFGVMGGFIAAQKEIIDYLKIFARTYMFTGGYLGALAAGVLKSFEIVIHDIERRDRLWRNTNYFRENLKRLGYNTLQSETPIVPIFIGEERIAIAIADELYDRGIFAPCVRWPSVAKRQSRIRFALMATHTKDHIDKVLDILENLGKKYKII